MSLILNAGTNNLAQKGMIPEFQLKYFLKVQEVICEREVALFFMTKRDRAKTNG